MFVCIIIKLYVWFKEEVFNVDDKTKNARGLIQKLLQKDPLRRLTHHGDIKGDTFFEGVQWDELLDRERAVAAAKISEVALREANKIKVQGELSGDSPDPFIETTIINAKKYLDESRCLQ